MSNILSKDKQVAAIAALCEGSSIRSVERITSIHRDTIMRLGIRVGETCAKIMDEEMRGLNCTRLELDEAWGFVGKKDKNCSPEDIEKGSTWTWIAVDADTKLVPCFTVGRRDAVAAKTFIDSLASRLNNRVQISTDGLSAYVEAIKRGFDYEVDYGQIVKSFSEADGPHIGKYSPPKIVKAERTIIEGNPDPKLISTSYVEAQNLTLRMHNRRMTRLTNAYSKKLENFTAAMSLHFAYYNFVKRHNTIRCTPAMAAGVTSGFWTVGDLVDMAS